MNQIDINEIINENIQKIILEKDINLIDKNGNERLVKNKNVNMWRHIYEFMNNVQVLMKHEWDGKNGNIKSTDINYIIDYIHNGIDDLIKYNL